VPRSLPASIGGGSSLPTKIKYPNLQPGEKEPDSPKVIQAKIKKAQKDKKQKQQTTKK